MDSDGELKMKLKKFRVTKKTVLALAAVVLVVAVGAYSCSLRSRAKGVHTNVSTTKLAKTNLQDTVSVSGTVKSDNSYNVYTTLTFPVKTVSADVGDTVKKGDVLAVLDTAGLEKDIEQQQYAAQDAEKSAALALEQAKAAYDNTLYLNNNGLNTNIVTAEANLKTAADAYNYNKLLFGNGQISKTQMDQSQSDYDKATKALAAAKNQAEQDLKNAKNAYDTAAAKAADKSAEVTLEKLKKNLSDATIVAPADGTVTVKNAAVGALPNGVLFVVESTDRLKVDAEIKEVDAVKVKAGNKVAIKTDATGDTAVEGTVASIAPAATAETQGTGDVTFAATVRITGKNPGIKIGMKAKMTIVMQEKPGVYTVSYDSLVTEDDGSSSVFVAEKSGAVYKAKKIPVKTGLETDVSVEISGNGIGDGALVLSNPEGVHDGDTLQLAKEG